jgi:hypothetical protein
VDVRCSVGIEAAYPVVRTPDSTPLASALAKNRAVSVSRGVPPATGKRRGAATSPSRRGCRRTRAIGPYGWTSCSSFSRSGATPIESRPATCATRLMYVTRWRGAHVP